MGNKEPNASLLYCCIKETIKQTLQIRNAITEFSIKTMMMPGLFLDLFMYWILTAPCKQTAAIISALHIRELNHCCGSVTQSCLTLCNPIDCSPPGFPVLHHLPEFAQTHVHQVGDAIQPSHPLSSLCPPAFNLSQHQSLFQWVSSSHQVAKGLEFQASASVLPINI